MVKHPAKYNDNFIPVFAKLLKGYELVLDPFAGTGKIGKIKEFGFNGNITCNEIESEWINSEYAVDKWVIGDAEFLPFKNKSFNAVCTSPTYGNRMADHFNASKSKGRITYRHFLGRELNTNNTGRMQWGNKYKLKHMRIYKELHRVLCDDGIMIINIGNHIRKGEITDVVSWHIDAADMPMKKVIKIKTDGMRFGKNNNLRVGYENIIVFQH